MFANLITIVLRPEIATSFEPKVVAISIRNTLLRIFQPNFGILLLLKGSFRECRLVFFIWISLEQKIVYKGMAYEVSEILIRLKPLTA